MDYDERTHSMHKMRHVFVVNQTMTTELSSLTMVELNSKTMTELSLNTTAELSSNSTAERSSKMMAELSSTNAQSDVDYDELAHSSKLMTH